MAERRQDNREDHDLLIRVDENVKNLVLELKSMKEVDLKELKDGTKADIENLKLTKADKSVVDDLIVEVRNIDRTVIKYVAYATAGMIVMQVVMAIIIKKFL